MATTALLWKEVWEGECWDGREMGDGGGEGNLVGGERVSEGENERR